MVQKTSNLNHDVNNTDNSVIPESFPAPTVILFSKRRAVFSKSVFALGPHHVTNSSYNFSNHNEKRRRIEDLSLIHI